MSKFLLYINDVLESLDIPRINNSTSKKLESSTKTHSNNIHLEEK